MSAHPMTATCRWLRSRGAYDQGLDPASLETATTSIDAYWCLRTMEAFGPDDRLVQAHACHPGRNCFRACEAPPVP